MSRINTNVSALIANRVLTVQNTRLNLSLQRLSTGLRINAGKDDPAGLIASEALRSEQAAIKASIYNIGRATNVVAVAEAGLVEISTLLTDLEDLVDRSSNEAGIGDDERAANQLQIDAILQSINRIANSTEFQGKKLLNGQLGYTTSGVQAADITDVSIESARLANQTTRAVVVEVTGSAQLGELVYSGSTVGSQSVTLEVTGVNGTDTVSFAANTAISAVAAAINDISGVTGVKAALSGTGTLFFRTSDYGSRQFVTVKTLQGAFTITGGTNSTDYGVDASVTVNGVAAAVHGLKASVRTSSLGLDLTLSNSFGTALGSSTFYITSGGANFQIAPRVTLAGLESIGLNSVSIGGLGNSADGSLATLASGGANALNTGFYDRAQRVIRAAQTQVNALRGRIGAFQKDTLDSTESALKIALENTTAAASALRDTDFAEETSNLTRQQILVQSATNVLRLANAAPQQILALLS